MKVSRLVQFMSLFGHAFSIYLSALRIGIVTVFRGRWREGLKQCIAPVGYWRLWPNAVILSEYDKYRPARILDVSSPKLPSLILGSKAEVWATDLEDPQLPARWKCTADAIGLRNYHVQFENACALSFPDASFDMVYSISVIEHIPGQGDTAALAEFQRVLKPGGVAIVEVPFRHTRQDVMQHYDSKGSKLDVPRFYERYYDNEWLDSRLQTPGLVVDQRWILGEWLPIDPWIATPRLPRLLRLLLLPLEPWLAMGNYWMRKDDKAGRPLAALLGTAAMLWVGGSMLIHGAAALGWHVPEAFVAGIAHPVADAMPVAQGFVLWLIEALAGLVLGLAIGTALIPVAKRVILPLWARLTGKQKAAH